MAKEVPSIGGPVTPVSVDAKKERQAALKTKKGRPEDRIEVNPVVIPEVAQPVSQKAKK